MAIDPTQQSRDLLKSGLKAVLPANSPIMQAGNPAIDPEEAVRQERKRNAAALGIPSEEENLVMARTAPTPEQLANDLVDPNIPITPPSQEVSTQTAAPVRAPAQGIETGSIQPTMQPPISGADAGFDKLTGELDAFKKQADEDLKRRQEFADKKSAEVQAELDKINANPVQIDNRSLWAKSSTGQKVLLSLGALLSSLSPNSAKAFQDNIQNTIDTDLKLQMDQLNQQRLDKKSLLSQLTQITGDKDAAASAYKSQVYGILASKLQLTAQKAQSKLQREQSLMTYDLAKQKQQAEYAEFQRKLMEKQDEGTVPGFEGRITDATEARSFKEAVQASKNINASLDELQRISKLPFKSLSPSARSDAESALGQITAELKTFKQLGTLDKGVEALVDKMIQNPTNFFSFDSSNQAKIMNFKKYINDGLARKAETLKLKPIGVPASFRK